LNYFEERYNADDVSYILEVPYSKVAYIEENYKKKREFLMTSRLPFEDGGYLCITPGLPTPRYNNDNSK
jgi:hypothetical protein